MKNNIYVISVGGSLIIPDDLNFRFIKKFKEIIESEIKKDKKFIIITGGGKIARKYQNLAKKLTSVSNEDLDWLGIHSTRLNAHLFLTLFRKYSYYRIIKNPNKKVKFKEKIIVAAVWKPRFSTDYDAVILAKTYNSKTIINFTNVDYVYDKDINKYKNAKPFKSLSWNEYLKLINQKWIPGLSAPFDPIASKLAKKLKFTCIILNGNKLKNFENFLKNKNFKGTIIHP